MSQVKIGIIGIMGRMGQALTAVTLDHENTDLIGGLVHKSGDAVGNVIKHPQTGVDTDVYVTDDLEALLEKSDVIVDFTAPAATVQNVRVAARTGTAMVIGTTGLSEDDETVLKNAAAEIPIVYASNYSAGVNLMLHLTKIAASKLDPSFDVEIVEMHHRDKVDAPSGTALSIGHAAAEGRGQKLEDIKDAGRDGITGKRKAGDIGFASLRGGNVAGEHTISFNADDERIEITHKAGDRSIFARGAVKAALWVSGKGAGLYDMSDVLGLKA